MSHRLRALFVLALATGLVLTTGQAAHAIVEPGGWIEYSPTFTVQQRGCGQVSGLTFRLTCSTANGDQRAERRYATYKGGSRQFEGTFRIVSLPGRRISLKQTFRSGPYFMLAVDDSRGRLYRVGGDTIADRTATVGARVRVNTVHVVGKTHKTYVNGSLKQTIKSEGGDFYDKFGAYRTGSGRGTAIVEWSDIHFWHK